MAPLAMNGSGWNANSDNRLPSKGIDLGYASSVPLRATEFRAERTLHAIPGNCNTGGSSAQAKDVHIVILDPLAR
jgi:hypothetical protein